MYLLTDSEAGRRHYQKLEEISIVLRERENREAEACEAVSFLVSPASQLKTREMTVWRERND